MKKLYLLLSISTLFIGKTYAQCPVVPSVTVQNQTAASCLSNGSVTLGGNGVNNPSVLYKMIAAPNNSYIGNNQQGINPTFSNLEPGNYKIEMSCTAGSNAKDTVAFTIANNYTAPSADLASSSGCSAGITTVALTLSNIQGSATPLQYAFYQGNDPNVADNLLTYSSSTSQTFNMFGNFIVRIKDACGNTLTKTINVAAPPTYTVFTSAVDQITSCTEALSDLSLIDKATGKDINTIPVGGINVKVYYAASPGSCIKGSLYSDTTFTAGTSVSGLKYRRPKHADLVIEIINACGDANTVCASANSSDPITDWTILNTSCSIPASNISLLLRGNNRFFGPVTYCAYKNNVMLFCTADPTDSRFANIASTIGDNFYVVATDSCGATDTSNVLTTPNAAAQVGLNGFNDVACTAGRTNAGISFSNIPQGDKASLVIASGPCCAGTVLATDLSGNSTNAYNLIPGTYTLKVTYPNGECSDMNFTLVVPQADNSIVLNAAVAQICGGGASITATTKPSNAMRNGLGSRTEVFYLINAASQIIDSNTTGVFNNVNPGTYIIKASSTFSNCTPKPVYTSQATVMVTAAGNAPVINKKYGIICESSNGTQLGNGSALFDVSGFGPYSVFYSTQNIQPGSPQLTGQTSPITISGLIANQTYYFWFQDNCGNTSTSQLAIVPLGKVPVEQATQPCNGSPFQLSMPEYPTASYTWKDIHGTVISSGRIEDFGIYQASFNGKYIGTMSLSNGCVVRVDTVILSSVLCGQPLPLKLLSFDAVKAGAYNNLNWTTADEKNVAGFEIERSADGANWNTIGIMSADVISMVTHAYSYQDQQPIAGTNYYRLKMVDKDQRYQYSQVVVIGRGEAAKTDLHIYPNPAHNSVTVELSQHLAGTCELSIYNATGVRIATQSVTNTKMVVNTENYPAGMYYIVVTQDSTTLFREKFTKL